MIAAVLRPLLLLVFFYRYMPSQPVVELTGLPVVEWQDIHSYLTEKPGLHNKKKLEHGASVFTTPPVVAVGTAATTNGRIIGSCP